MWPIYIFFDPGILLSNVHPPFPAPTFMLLGMSWAFLNMETHFLPFWEMFLHYSFDNFSLSFSLFLYLEFLLNRFFNLLYLFPKLSFLCYFPFLHPLLSFLIFLFAPFFAGGGDFLNFYFYWRKIKCQFLFRSNC